MQYKDEELLTQDEAIALVSFIAETAAALVGHNNDALLDGEDFVRLQDVGEVIDALKALHNKATYEELDYDYSDKDNIKVTTAKRASYNLTAGDARDALLHYDTEYRECMTEEFAYAHKELASKLYNV